MNPIRWCLGSLLLMGLLAACGTRATTQGAAPPALSRAKVISRLIDQLRLIDQGDIGYMPTMTGSGFLPLGTTQPRALLFGGGVPASSSVMRDLVKHGVAAVPLLIAHLDDKRSTKITLKHDDIFGGMFALRELDWTSRTDKRGPKSNKGGDSEMPERLTTYTVTVGDLCFVALGQIVNRPYSAVRYQPTAIIWITSPTYSKDLRNAIIKQWGKLTATAHKQSLVHDFLEPDRIDKRIGATLRLGYYYRETLEPLAVKQLMIPCYDSWKVEGFVHDKLYPIKDLIKRKSLLDAFILKEGKAARDGILLQLFCDLNEQELDEGKRRWPPLEPAPDARTCLVKLFGYSQAIKSKNSPRVSSVATSEQVEFIDAIKFFPSEKIDKAVRKLLHSIDDDYVAEACARYLAGRGADSDVRNYVEKRLKGAKGKRRKELLRLLQQLAERKLQ
jgi:hypothetical protein